MPNDSAGECSNLWVDWDTLTDSCFRNWLRLENAAIGFVWKTPLFGWVTVRLVLEASGSVDWHSRPENARIGAAIAVKPPPWDLMLSGLGCDSHAMPRPKPCR